MAAVLNFGNATTMSMVAIIRWRIHWYPENLVQFFFTICDLDDRAYLYVQPSPATTNTASFSTWQLAPDDGLSGTEIVCATSARSHALFTEDRTAIMPRYTSQS